MLVVKNPNKIFTLEMIYEQVCRQETYDYSVNASIMGIVGICGRNSGDQIQGGNLSKIFGDEICIQDEEKSKNL